jgi:acetyl-CoA C-acetyltransferase
MGEVDPRAPVLVGVGAVTQRVTDPYEGDDAWSLMVAAAERAGADSGAARTLESIDLVLVPKGIWSYRDPGRAVAKTFGANPRSVLAEVGVLQQTLLTRAAQSIVDGDANVVLICGAEAKQRAVLAARAGIALDDPDPSTAAPDELLEPTGEIYSRAEIERDLAPPAHQYALIESVLAHEAHRTPDEQRRRAAELWSRFGAVAAANDIAWDQRGPSADEIATITRENRMIATPYAKLLCSQWNVDQSAAAVLMAAETATALGVPRDQWVFAHSAAESNHMVVMPRRAEVHRWPAFEAVAEALGLRGPDAILPPLVELYSCFPAAVQVQAAALGLPIDCPLTVSGGMTFAGGPLNSAVLQGLVPLVGRLRAQPAATGLITSVSAILTKPGASLWSATPPAGGFRATDVTEEAKARTEVVDLLPDATGPATIVADTVVFERAEPSRVVAVLDVEGGRTIARCTDRGIASAMTESDWVGRAVRVTTPGVFVVD